MEFNGFTINIDENDLKEVKENYDNLSQFLLNEFCSFSAAAFVLQSVMDAVTAAEKEMES